MVGWVRSHSSERSPGYTAAVFDLDGVVTFTARVHFAAWKELFDEFLRERSRETGEPLHPFTEADYRDHVDGLPRHDGVRGFLASRGITLPEGGPSDAPQARTVSGLAERKNEVFQAQIRSIGVDIDEEAVRLIQELRSRGIVVGVASSSRNTPLILETAGLDDLFDARVDGSVAERLRLAGKPEPDIFLACLDLLGGHDPARALVVEDAVAGVEAGRAGGFGLVLGVDRGGRAIALREHGADWVVRGFADVTYERLDTYFHNREHARPNALTRWSEIAADLQARRPALFLDYDGTLTPIVSRPDLARLSPEMRESLQRVSEVWPTTIVSGRGREDVTALVGIDSLNYAGSHGFDIFGPSIGNAELDIDPELVPAVTEAADSVARTTAAIPGVLVENKKFAVAVHYRLVEPDRVDEVERAVDEALAGRPALRKTGGKKVFELRPSMPWDKGRAILWLMEALRLGPDVVPIYLGDDETDEDAFRVLETRGIGIVVTELPRPTSARYSLQDVDEVRAWLERLTSLDGRSQR